MKYRVIHLVRKVSSTSMPWNDLYCSHRAENKLNSGYVFAVSGIFNAKIKKDQNKGISYFNLGFISSLLVIFKKRRKFANFNRTYIFHVHNMSLVPLALIIKFIGFKIVLNVHNSLINFNNTQYALMKYGINRFHSIVCVSHSVRDEVLVAFPDLESKCVAIQNCINSNEMREIQKSHISDEIDLIIVARFVEQKNVSRIINVLSHCKSLKKIVWFGDGILIEDAKRQVANSSLHDKFFFMGIKPREEVLKSIRSSKIYLSLSKWEGIGVANLEALSLPTEVILSNIPPHCELFLNNNLHLVDLKIPDFKIALLIDDVLNNFIKNDPRLLARAEETCKNFDLKNLVYKYTKIYESLCET